MATVPGRLETGIAALAAALAADVTLAANVIRRGNDIDPEDLAEPDAWPDGTRCLVALIDGDGASGGAPRERGLSARFQTATLYADLYTRADDQADASTEFHTRRRQLLNVVEALRESTEYESDGWTLDHAGWRRKGGVADLPPYVAARISIVYNFRE